MCSAPGDTDFHSYGLNVCVDIVVNYNPKCG